MDYIIMETIHITNYTLYGVVVGAVIGAAAVSYIIGRLEKNRPHDVDDNRELRGNEIEEQNDDFVKANP